MATGKLSNAIFYGISNGKIIRQFSSKTQKSVERINKNGKTVHEEFYDFLDGFIVDISVREHDEYGKFWVVSLRDEASGITQNLQFNYSSGYANGFLKALPNVDLSQKVKIMPSARKEGDKTKTTIFIGQHENAVKWYYTKAERRGLPDLKKIKIKGKETWDDTEAMAFLEKMVKDMILPKLAKQTIENIPSLSDDLPF
jgi:hypothetical protein